MITAVDTNVLIDVLEPDPVHGPGSRDALKRCLREGRVVACEVVWAEAATAYGDVPDDLIRALGDMGIDYSAMTPEAALAAARSWHAFRQQGRVRQRIVADFLIGGHAQVQCDRLLSRDRGFYRRYFDALQVLTPA